MWREACGAAEVGTPERERADWQRRQLDRREET